MPQSDETAIRACLAGDTRAFDELVTRYQARVFGLCYHMLHDREESADLAQEVFVRAYQRLHLFDLARPFRPWLMTIAANLAVNRLKSRGPAGISLDQSPTADPSMPPRELRSPDRGPHEQAAARELRRRLEGAIGALPDPYRMVALLRHLEGFSYQEIAAALGLPLGTVKTHLFRAKKLLREHLADYEQT